MRLIAPLADRMLSRVVPRVTAAGCCSPDNHLVYCFCSGGRKYEKACHYECDCSYVCGGCVNRNIAC
jgi:hypothetical protein